MLFLELQKGKQRMAQIAFVHDLAATAACTKRMVVGGEFTGSGRVVVGGFMVRQF